MTEQHPQWAQRLQYVPDPAELKGSRTYDSARNELGIPDDAVVVLVYGAIDERKGLDLLVNALSGSDVPKYVHILVVGKQSKSIQPLMNSKQFTVLVSADRCYVINSYVDDAMEQIVFAASDVVWLGYRDQRTILGMLLIWKGRVI